MEFTNEQLQVSNKPPTGSQWKVRSRGEEIRGFILSNIETYPREIASHTALKFSITRQAANKHLQKLVAEKALTSEGETRQRSYKLATMSEWDKVFTIASGVEEDQAWRHDVAPALGALPQNVLDIWHFCVTEMLNNAIDHSGGATIFVKVAKTAANTQILLMDDGIGIFKKIQSEMSLLDERHALLELSKGKLTTDPEKHTGQGIFFTSRLVDSFDILSGGGYFTHTFGSEEDWILERPKASSGTSVFMKLNNHSSRTCKSIFDQYSSGDDYAFTKTVIPVKLAQYGQDKLISRSQAKRLLSRIDLFKTVLFNFEGVESIGQALADEIFRVFAKGHPEIDLIPISANPEVQQVIASTRSQWVSEVEGAIS